MNCRIRAGWRTRVARNLASLCASGIDLCAGALFDRLSSQTNEALSCKVWLEYNDNRVARLESLSPGRDQCGDSCEVILVFDRESFARVKTAR